MKASSTSIANSKSPNKAAALVATTAAGGKQHTKQSPQLNNADSSPDSDDSSRASPEAAKESATSTAEGNASTTTPTIPVQHHSAFNSTSSPASKVTPTKDIIISEQMSSNYLFYPGEKSALQPITRTVNCAIKNSKERKDKRVFSTDLVRYDSKIVTVTIWEEPEGPTIPFFEKFFK